MAPSAGHYLHFRKWPTWNPAGVGKKETTAVWCNGAVRAERADDYNGQDSSLIDEPDPIILCTIKPATLRLCEHTNTGRVNAQASLRRPRSGLCSSRSFGKLIPAFSRLKFKHSRFRKRKEQAFLPWNIYEWKYFSFKTEFQCWKNASEQDRDETQRTPYDQSA